jgi:hypothetical protein
MFCYIKVQKVEQVILVIGDVHPHAFTNTTTWAPAIHGKSSRHTPPRDSGHIPWYHPSFVTHRPHYTLRAPFQHQHCSCSLICTNTQESVALQPLLSVSWSFSLQTVGLLERVISSPQGLYLNTGQHKHRINTYTKHPCPEWDSSPRSQCPSERRQFMP